MLRLTELFFHSTYRIGRARFVFGASILLALSAAIWWGDTQGLPVWFGVLAKLIIGYSAMCVMSLRLHDVGRSGWWGWIIIASAALADHLEGWHVLVPLGGIAIGLFVMALVPGQPRLNRHGPPL